MPAKMPEVQIVGEQADGSPGDMSILDKENVAYDPTQMTVDLTKAEKRRTTALLLAIQAYDKLIIKDAEYLREMHNEARREGGPVIQPATMNAMVDAAIQFDAFIAGRFDPYQDEPEAVPAESQPATQEQPE